MPTQTDTTQPKRRIALSNRKTFSAKPHEMPAQRKWFIIDAADQVLGKVAVTAANLLRGKNKVTFTRHADTGDYVIVINAEKVVLTGKKEEQKKYYTHSGYIGHQKMRTALQLRKHDATRMIHLAVKGMVPHTRLGRAQLTKLRVFNGPEHTFEAKNPAPIKVA